MPCNCDYMEPSKEAINSKETAEHLVYISKKLPYIKLPKYVAPAARNQYGDAANLNNMVVLLCDILTTMRNVDLEDIVYNAKCKKSRRLADWWEEHQKADKKRIAKENKKKKEKNTLQDIKNKLTPEEWEVIENYANKDK